MNLVLIGYRGSGKSAIAVEIGKRHDREVWHLDERIEQHAGKSIPEIVEEEGWEGFRDRESEIVIDASQRHGIIIDCGGGAILREQNVKALRVQGRIVYLTYSPDILAERIEGDANRPSLTGQGSAAEEVERVLGERRPLYEAAAHFMIDTGENDLDTCATIIMQWYLDPAGELPI